MTDTADNSRLVSSNPAGHIRFRLAAALLGYLAGNTSLEIRCADNDFNARPSNGTEARFGIELQSAEILWQMLRDPDPGLGEAYMNNQWNLYEGDLGELLTRLAKGRDQLLRRTGIKSLLGFLNSRAPLFSHTIDASYKQVQHHYDIGNDLYRAFLDDGMNYSCGFYANPSDTLRDAQLNKIHTSLQRLQIQPGMRVLDIGCGWGETTRVISSQYHAAAVGITLAENQLAIARERAASMARPPTYRLQDYRQHAQQHPESYDRIISIGMVEHVGKDMLDGYFQAIVNQLKPGGMALVHSIVTAERPPTKELGSPWLVKYIFPGGGVPSIALLSDAAASAGLQLQTNPFVHDSSHYAHTLIDWRQNFLTHWPELKGEIYDDRFRRMWLYYLCMCEAMFAGAGGRVAQVLLKKPPNAVHSTVA